MTPPRPPEPAPSAYGFPLLIRHLLHTPLAHAPDQEILYGDRVHYSYTTLHERIGRLASGLIRQRCEDQTQDAMGFGVVGIELERPLGCHDCVGSPILPGLQRRHGGRNRRAPTR